MTRKATGIVILATAAVLAGCGGGSDEETAGDGTTSEGVTIADFAFDPQTITVPAGTEITFTNTDSTEHTATADDGSFDTGSLKQDAEGKVTLDEPGTFDYICDIHPTMHGTVEVE